MKIKELYVVLAFDSNGKEGIAAAVNPVTKIMEPLIGDENRIEDIMSIARAGVTESSLEFELVKFTNRESIEMITPEVDDVEG